MISKPKQVRVVRTDLNTGQTECLCECACEVAGGNQLFYTETGPDRCPDRVEIQSQSRTIQRQGGAVPTMFLVLHQRSVSRIQTEFGVFEIGNLTTLLEQTEDCWRVAYEIGEPGQPSDRFQIEWFFKEAEA